jgi:hypothetical protein
VRNYTLPGGEATIQRKLSESTILGRKSTSLGDGGGLGVKAVASEMRRNRRKYGKKPHVNATHIDVPAAPMNIPS